MTGGGWKVACGTDPDPPVAEGTPGTTGVAEGDEVTEGAGGALTAGVVLAGAALAGAELPVPALPGAELPVPALPGAELPVPALPGAELAGPGAARPGARRRRAVGRRTGRGDWGCCYVLRRRPGGPGRGPAGPPGPALGRRRLAGGNVAAAGIAWTSRSGQAGRRSTSVTVSVARCLVLL